MTDTLIHLAHAAQSCKTGLMRAALSAMHYSGLARVLAPHTRGRGVIFTLHSVDPTYPPAFDPNGILRVTPEFLEQAIETTLAHGYDIVSLDEAARRIASVEDERPFACFTFDDGYRDNRDHAYPIFKRHGVPMAIYVPSAYLDGQGDLWWLVLENAIRAARSLDVQVGGERFRFATASAIEKSHAFHKVYWALRKLPEREMRAKVAEIAQAAGYDASTLCRALIMTWDEVRELARDPLVTIAAHTTNHMAIAKLPVEAARAEIAESVRRVEAELGRPCRHFSFPYGDATSAAPRDFEIARSLGLATAVTTHKDVIRAEHAAVLGGLPRVSLNGNFQAARFVSVFLSGVPFATVAALKAVRRKMKAWLAGGRSSASRPAHTPV